MCVSVFDFILHAVMTNVDLRWRIRCAEYRQGGDRISANLICICRIWKWPKSNLKISDSCDLCCSYCHYTIRSGSRRGQKIRFEPLGPAVWTQPKRPQSSALYLCDSALQNQTCSWRNPDPGSPPRERSSRTICLSTRQKGRAKTKDWDRTQLEGWLINSALTRLVVSAVPSAISPVVLFSSVCLFTCFRAVLPAVFVHCSVDGIRTELIGAIVKRMWKVNLEIFKKYIYIYDSPQSFHDFRCRWCNFEKLYGKTIFKIDIGTTIRTLLWVCYIGYVLVFPSGGSVLATPEAAKDV